MIVLSAVLLVALASTSDAYTVKAGDHLFVRGKVFICDDATHFIEHAEVAESGEVVFGNRFKLKAAGLKPPEIAARLADSIGAVTGRRPTTLSIEAVPAADAQHIALNLMTLLHEPRCARSVMAHDPSDEPGEPVPAQEYNDRISEVQRSACMSHEIG